jgi:hypothetical protein
MSKKAKALGVPNQITVICDEVQWEGQLGDTLTSYLGSVYPVLPRPEALYDIKYFSPFDIRVEKLRRELRTYLICASAESDSSEAYQLVRSHLGEKADFSKPRLLQKKNQWATGQILLYLIAPTDSALVEAFKTYLPSITEQVHNHDMVPLRAKTYLKGKNIKLSQRVDSLFSVKMDVPGDYLQAMVQDSFIWLRKDFEDIIINLLVQEVPYRSEEQLTQDYIKSLRNKLGKKYVSSDADSSYMVINDVDLPMYTFQRQISGSYTLQSKGIWEMEYDFMGGPFVSYLVVRKDRGTLLFMDGFVLAPGRKKRNLMQEIEVILEGVAF